MRKYLLLVLLLVAFGFSETYIIVLHRGWNLVPSPFLSVDSVSTSCNSLSFVGVRADGTYAMIYAAKVSSIFETYPAVWVKSDDFACFFGISGTGEKSISFPEKGDSGWVVFNTISPPKVTSVVKDEAVSMASDMGCGAGDFYYFDGGWKQGVQVFSTESGYLYTSLFKVDC